LFGSAATAGHSERPLRVLAILTLVFPAIAFLIAARISYLAHFEQAGERLERTVDVGREHAVKVFDTFELGERFMEQLFEGVTDDDIRAREEYFSTRLRHIIEPFPQLRDLWLIDSNGHPLVSGTIYPMPRNLDLSDRNFFNVHRVSDDVDVYISQVVEARAADTNFFAITRKRPAQDGKFAGIFLVSIAPEYFNAFYARLPQADTSVVALLRSDGAVLARYPVRAQSERGVSPSSMVANAARTNPDHGVIRGVSPIDHVDRVVAYQRLPKNGVYVVAGIDADAVKQDWLETMGSHLIFGVPATLSMFILTMMALSRTRQEANAFRRLSDETELRQSTELALQQAHKMEAVGQLTGGIAHDFNNLLTIISGNLDTVRRRLTQSANSDETRQLADNLAKPLDHAVVGAQRAAELTHRLLAFARRQTLKPESIDLNSLISNLSELLRRSLGEDVSIETVLAAGLWPTFADRNQIENALLNLAINARDAMPGGGRLTIETANVYLDEAYVGGFSEVAPGQYVMVSVTDAGTGIPPELLEKVFEPFFTTKPVGQGSGLGLAMVHGFVKQSGGHVRIYSEVGQGTTAKIYLPRLNAKDLASAGPPVVEVAPPPAPGASAHETILLVEDNDAVREYAMTALGELGYAVLSAGDASEAMAIVERGTRFDLLFTDVVLPGGVNGRELATEILKLRPDVPVLFTTGYTRNAIIHHGRLDADVHLLGKPYAQQDLARKIRALLDSRGNTSPTLAPA
jgi:two-component system NtrC family sensor kinase